MPNNYELGNETNGEDTPYLEADILEPAPEQGWPPDGISSNPV